MHHTNSLLTILLLFGAISFQTMTVSAADRRPETLPDTVRQKVAATLGVMQTTQQKEDSWADTKEKLKGQYRSLQTEVEYLAKTKKQNEQSEQIQKEEIREIEHKLRESGRIREELQSYIETLIDNLEQIKKAGLPFLPQERTKRFAALREILNRPDTSLAEKYRRVMEAIQIETEYGRTAEVYQDTIELNGTPCLADILRVGRLALFCRTPDGALVGTFNPRLQQWTTLPTAYRQAINTAMEIARRERAIELVKLPLGRIIVP